MTNSKLFYKEATPVSLNKILLQSPFIKEHSKLIPRIVRTLNKVLAKNHRDDGKSDITYKFFADRFGSQYPEIVLALETLGLMTNDRIWIKKSEAFRGKCFSYLLTPKCQRALADVNKEYLYKLLQDKPTIRQNQFRISHRGYNTKVYGDIRDTLKDAIDGITIDLNQAEKVIGAMPDGKKAFVYSLLVDVVRRDYGELHYNVKDGRIWTPYTQLPAEIKQLIMVNGLEYQQTIDIRSCYPSLWAEYVVRCGNISPTDLQPERLKWNGLFLNKSIDPKAVIAKAIGISRDELKPVMIQYFNGKTRGKAFRAFDKWLGEQFPCLYSAWQQTDIKQTGNNIGKLFETKLMLDESIYNKAEMLGIIIGYEYDGMSFYAKDDTRCQELMDYIEQRSVELLGIKLVFVDKVNTMDIAQVARENDMRHLEASHKKWVAVCRHTFRKANRSPNWEEFRNERENYYHEVSRFFEIQNNMERTHI